MPNVFSGSIPQVATLLSKTELQREFPLHIVCSWLGNSPRIAQQISLLVTLDMAVKHAISHKKYWRMSGAAALRFAMTNEWLLQQVLVSLKQLWYAASLRGTA